RRRRSASAIGSDAGPERHLRTQEQSAPALRRVEAIDHVVVEGVLGQAGDTKAGQAAGTDQLYRDPLDVRVARLTVEFERMVRRDALQRDVQHQPHDFLLSMPDSSRSLSTHCGSGVTISSTLPRRARTP